MVTSSGCQTRDSVFPRSRQTLVTANIYASLCRRPHCALRPGSNAAPARHTSRGLFLGERLFHILIRAVIEAANCPTGPRRLQPPLRGSGVNGLGRGPDHAKKSACPRWSLANDFSGADIAGAECLLRVTSGHSLSTRPCPLFPQQQTLGTPVRDVRYGPEADHRPFRP